MMLSYAKHIPVSYDYTSVNLNSFFVDSTVLFKQKLRYFKLFCSQDY